MADLVGNYLVVRENDQDVRIELGEQPAYSIMPDSNVIRIWDECRTYVVALDRLVNLCIPNFRPR